jgi:alcohol dehydrogenase class IV
MEREFIGAGSVKRLAEIVNQVNPDKVFIVSGKSSYKSSGAKDAIEQQLKKFSTLRYSEFGENPEFNDILKGVKNIRKFSPELIIAVGGGSVLDTAKVISVLPDDPVIAEKIVKREVAVPPKIAPIIAIPTTSGSGSEATKFAVVYLDKKKYSVVSEDFLPDYVLIDPELTYSLPPYQTAVSGMDALCQSVESFWAKGATTESKEYSREAINLILKNLEKSVNNPDAESRFGMAMGANLAGKAINRTRTTAPHAMSYALTTFYGIPHGHAVALTLGEFFQLNSERALATSRQDLVKVMEELFELFDCSDAIQCRDKFYGLMGRIGLKTKLSQMLQGELNISKLVNNVNVERLSNHPVVVTKADIKAVYQKILR